MKESIVSEKAWRTVQMFLTQHGVYEVEVNTETHSVRCDCAAFVQRNTCVHERHVDKNARQNGGTYPVKISSRATEEEAETAQHSAEAFRSFILKYGKVEVL